MTKLKYAALFLFGTLLLISCSSVNNSSWSEAIPEDAPFVIIPAEDATLNSILHARQAPFLDDITSSAIQILSEIDSTARSSIKVKSIVLYPGSDKKLETIWITEPSGYLNALTQKYHQNFAQNEYYFNDISIQKLHLQNRSLFGAHLNDLVVLSESSLGVEEVIRAYMGEAPHADLSHLKLQPGHIIMNTPSLDKGIRQLAKVKYHPIIKNALRGTKPTLLTINREGKEQNIEYRFSGTIPIDSGKASPLVQAISDANLPITLDRYISSNAAAFGLFRQTPSTGMPDSLPDTTRIDSVLFRQQERYGTLSRPLDKEVALVMYAESGFLSTGEHLFLRKLKDAGAFKEAINRLVDERLAELRSGTYYLQSRALARLLGSPLCSFTGFYLNIVDDVLAISKRRGLTEIVQSDNQRRRTMFYERTFRTVKENLPDSVSSLFVTNTNFDQFIEPFVYPDSYTNALLSKFDFLTAATTLDEDKQNLQLQIQTHRASQRTNPYEENWLFTQKGGLSGSPALADMGGSSRQEIIFASEAGRLYVLASDGTTVFEAKVRPEDTPVGSPVVYDWYGTNQKVILLAAGNKVYGWDEQGDLLPRFPFVLEEQITAPLVVSDIDGNGLPNALVATANRKLHALNGRGQDASGWPVTTNAQITTPPAVGEFRRSKTVIAFSGNAAHAWRSNGSSQAGFPIFVNAPLNGSPVIYKEKILGNAADGNLYAIGPGQLFADSLDVASSNTKYEAIYVSNSALTGTPVVEEMRIRSNDGQTYEGPSIVTTDINGSFFVFNSRGNLLLNRNMSQPANQSFAPLVTDINRDDQNDILTLADYGRLYAWQAIDGSRLHILPSTGMQHPAIADIDENGYPELVAQTDQGVRCWTIFGE